MILHKSAIQSRRLFGAVAIAAVASIGLLPAFAGAQEPAGRPGGPVTIDYDMLDALGIDRGPVVAAVQALVH